MLVKFRSKAAADVTMYEEHAKRMLGLLGKDAKLGIITAAEMPRAISRLEDEIAESKKHPVSEEMERDVVAHHGDQGDDNEHEPPEYVSFGTRAYPLLEMLRAAHKGNNDVMWGVY
jgi:hypothetical protein